MCSTQCLFCSGISTPIRPFAASPVLTVDRDGEHSTDGSDGSVFSYRHGTPCLTNGSVCTTTAVENERRVNRVTRRSDAVFLSNENSRCIPLAQLYAEIESQVWGNRFEVRVSRVNGGSGYQSIGRGVFATCDIPRQSWLFDYPGRRVPFNDFDSYSASLSPEERDNMNVYIQEVPSFSPFGAFYIVSHEHDVRGYGHMVNHTPHPKCCNCAMRRMTVRDGQGNTQVHAMLYATRDILSGEEVLRDYGSAYQWGFPKVDLLCPRCHR